jgi:hypothetical protein
MLDIFLMPTLFLLSGYFAPLSLKSANGWQFVKSRFKRLMVPWLIAVLTLLPLYKFIFLYSRSLPQENWTTYFHWSNGIWSVNWLWFLPVLFLFDVVFALLHSARLRPPNISLNAAIAVTFVSGFAYSLSMDMWGLQGWTKTWLLDFQNERLLIYFMFFLLGTLCFKRNTFSTEPQGKLLYFTVNALAWVPITAYITFLLNPWLNPGNTIVGAVADKWVLWLSFHVSMLCLVYLVVESFRRYQRKQGILRRELSRNSYYVYIIHVVVIGLLALAMRSSTIPSLTKHLLLAIATFAVCNVIISLLRAAWEWRSLPGNMIPAARRTAPQSGASPSSG